MKNYELYWRDEVHKSVIIKAESKEEALQLWKDGEYSPTDCYEQECMAIEEPDVDTSILELEE